MSFTPPGFYPDSSGVSRWWDGVKWITGPAPAAPPQGQDKYVPVGPSFNFDIDVSKYRRKHRRY